MGCRGLRFRVLGVGFASAAGALSNSVEILSPRVRPQSAIFFVSVFGFFNLLARPGPLCAFASSLLFLGSGPLSSLFWVRFFEFLNL